ncbi:MAG: adenylyltransferase/cytidyltransferase family protein [Bacteroidetes bacterium]|nr:adenylyltransferase/cytidyltransferase family protein [Bacteroidota bacterium]
MKKKVFVTGCYDMLHSGHIAFFQEAALHGDVYVGLGSDKTVYNLKGKYPINNQDERKYMIDSLKYVKQSMINTGSGIMDFSKEIEMVNPDIFIVNEDGNTPAKEEFCKKKGIEYLVLKRVPYGNLPSRSTTALRQECTMPFRIDLAGGWLDQPFVGIYSKGPVITISIEPTIEFNERSGMASSTRRKAIELWHTDVPPGDREKLAKMLFSYENPPGTKIIAGSQDSIGIVMPGLNKLDYEGNYWPAKITSICDEDVLSWLERHIYLITLGPRVNGYDVLDNTEINKENAKALSDAAEMCWISILNKKIKEYGIFLKKSFEAQVKMFPNMVYDDIFKVIDRYKNRSYGWKLSGAGGGGYLIFIADKKIEGAIQIKIRRSS